MLLMGVWKELKLSRFVIEIVISYYFFFLLLFFFVIFVSVFFVLFCFACDIQLCIMEERWIFAASGSLCILIILANIYTLVSA